MLVQIEPEFLGIPVDLYLKQLVGKKITGATSGVTAEVVTYITDQESENGNFTIYVDYYESSLLQIIRLVPSMTMKFF